MSQASYDPNENTANKTALSENVRIIEKFDGGDGHLCQLLSAGSDIKEQDQDNLHNEFLSP